MGFALSSRGLFAVAVVIGFCSALKVATADEPGQAVGPFALKGGITAGTGVESNLFATQNDPVGDAFTILSPQLSLDSTWKQHSLKLFAGADYARYWHETDEDYLDIYAGFDARIDLTGRNYLFGGFRFDRAHEERSSPDDQAGKEPTIYNQYGAYLGFFQEFGKAWIRAGVTSDLYDFDDAKRNLGPDINHDDRDRWQHTAGGRIGFSVSPSWDLFVQGSADARRYRRETDDLGFRRGSTGGRFAVGAIWDLGNDSEIEALVGYLFQDYRDSRFRTAQALDIGARLSLNPAAGVKIRGEISREIEETTLAGSSGYLNTIFSLGAAYLVRPNLSVDVSASFINSAYLSSSRNDRVITAALDVKRYLTEHLFVGGNYRFIQRASNEDGEDFDDNIFLLRFGVQLQPEFNDRDLAAAAERDRRMPTIALPGFYFGAQLGYGMLHTALEGPRAGGAGLLTAEFGDTGPTAGIFAGYGIGVGRWHLGIEVEGEGATVDWHHARLPGGRVFDVEKELTVGSSFRLGYALESGALIYGRAGAVLSKFDTTYIPPSGEDRGREHWGLGWRFGGGAEIPAGDGVFVRLDYTYTTYGDYEAGPNSGKDDFVNSESLARFGVGYRFGANMSENETFRHDFSGPYAGIQVAHSGIATRNVGPREGASTLKADRAGHGGLAGVFAGFGWVWQALYLGAEVEADTGYSDWTIERDPTGRVYSVRRRESLSASLRLGYVIAERALLY